MQPALLVAAIVSAVGFALTAGGSAQVLALVGAAGFVVTLAASLAILVPLQRRIVATKPADAGTIDKMRARWFRGNLGRSAPAFQEPIVIHVFRHLEGIDEDEIRHLALNTSLSIGRDLPPHHFYFGCFSADCVLLHTLL